MFIRIEQIEPMPIVYYECCACVYLDAQLGFTNFFLSSFFFTFHVDIDICLLFLLVFGLPVCEPFIMSKTISCTIFPYSFLYTSDKWKWRPLTHSKVSELQLSDSEKRFGEHFLLNCFSFNSNSFENSLKS